MFDVLWFSVFGGELLVYLRDRFGIHGVRTD